MQTKLASFLEALVQTLVGYIINLGVQLIVYPIYGVHFSLLENMEIGLVFLIVSLARSYLLRRLFNVKLG